MFPKITYLGIDKTGYTIHTFSGAGACTSARTWVESTFGGSPGLTGNHVVYITGATPCTYGNSNNSTVNIRGNLMIISDWGIDISNKSTWAATTTDPSVYFISTWRATGTQRSPDACGSGSSSKVISTGNNTDFNSNAQAFFYSPCTVSMSNQSNFYGQVMGDPVHQQPIHDDVPPRAGSRLRHGHLLQGRHRLRARGREPVATGRRHRPGRVRTMSDAWIRALVAVPFGWWSGAS